MIAWLLASWQDVLTQATPGGYAAALAFICLIQYVASLYGMTSSRNRNSAYKNQIDGLSTELSNLARDRQINRYENQLLREFVTQSDSGRAIALVLRRILPTTEEGFVVFFRPEGDRFVVDQSRGLSSEGRLTIAIDDSLLAQLITDPTIVLESQTLQRSALWASLNGLDRAKARSLFLLGMVDEGKLLGVIVSTQLFPAGVERPQQLELAERLIQSIGTTLRQRQSFEEQQSRLHLTSEMLQLREIADRKYDGPFKMIEELTRQLVRRCDASRGVLVLNPPEPGQALRVLAEGGEPLAIGIRDAAQKHLETLGREGLATQSILYLDSEALRRLGVLSLFGSALVVPLVQPHATIAALVLVRSQSSGFTKDAEALARWGADHLKTVLTRAVTQAHADRLARQDGLTELANRRTFDSQVQVEIQQAREYGTNCSLLIFDLDRFKSVNDRYGHRGGDLVLKSAAAVLRDKVSRVRASDRVLCARYGGEELVVLLPGFNAEGAMRVAETIRVGIEALEIDFDGTIIRATTSGGVATYPLHCDSADELVSAADAALYEAKASGRNRILKATERTALSARS